MESLGLKRGTVKLIPYTSQWDDIFIRERQKLITLIGPYCIDIQHVGSTAIPGSCAKPIIDIAIAVQKETSIDILIPIIAKAGYIFMGDRENRGDVLFVKGDEERRTHYIHIMEYSSEQWNNYIRFRDYLRTHPKTLDAYNVLKIFLEQKYKTNRTLYTKGKEKFIKDVLAEE
jgi:GrpB-like predicted nucleotidyltransferase (UPF0157 family)